MSHSAGTPNSTEVGKRLWRVIHPAHGAVEVEAHQRYDAVVEAAKEWGLRWTTIARDCRVTELGPAPRKWKGAARGGKADEEKP